MKTRCPYCTEGYTQGPEVIPGFANINKCSRCKGTGKLVIEPVWYLWAINNDPTTNEYFAKVIGEQNMECQHSDKLCADGKKRNLYECPKGYVNVQSAISAMLKFNLKFEVFKEDVKDTITRFELWKNKVHKAARESRMIK